MASNLKRCLEYRIDQLTKARDCFSHVNSMYWEYEARLDEVRSMLELVNRLEDS